MTRMLLIAALGLTASAALAHHGSNSQFDWSKPLVVAGTVTKIRFVNPHSYVYLEVANDEGGMDEWRCEMRAASALKRSGWTQEMFSPGAWIKIAGIAARREAHGCYVETITFEDGEIIERYAQLANADRGNVVRTLRLDDGAPNLNGNWAAPQRLLTNPGSGSPPETAAPPPTPPPGQSADGPPPTRRDGASQYVQTEAGRQAASGFQREDNPRFHCMATNIFLDWWFDQHVNRIEQNENAITLTYGFMDLVRTIHLDREEHPASITPSRAGHSIGRWEGDTLVVDTVGFEEGYLDTRVGVKHSDQLHVAERFSLSEDGKTLVREFTGTDPLYLTEPFTGRDEVSVSEAEFEPYNCEDLTEEVVEGF